MLLKYDKKIFKKYIHLFHIFITYYHSDNVDKTLYVAYQNVVKRYANRSIIYLLDLLHCNLYINFQIPEIIYFFFIRHFHSN